MVDLKFIVKKIKSVALREGYSVDERRCESVLADEAKRLAMFKHVYNTPEGKWVLDELMSEGKHRHISFI